MNTNNLSFSFIMLYLSGKNNSKHPMTLVRQTLHNKRFNTKEINARQEKENGNGLINMVDDVALGKKHM